PVVHARRARDGYAVDGAMEEDAARPRGLGLDDRADLVREDRRRRREDLRPDRVPYVDGRSRRGGLRAARARGGAAAGHGAIPRGPCEAEAPPAAARRRPPTPPPGPRPPPAGPGPAPPPP